MHSNKNTDDNDESYEEEYYVEEEIIDDDEESYLEEFYEEEIVSDTEDTPQQDEHQARMPPAIAPVAVASSVAALFAARAPVAVASRKAFARSSFSSDTLWSQEDLDLIDSYKKKLKIGVPEPAVRKKMADDGVTNERILKAVFSAASIPVARSSYQALQPTLASPSTKPAAVGPLMSEDDTAIVMSYRKKLKIGLPEPAVRKKMADDGITDQNIYAAVFSAVEPTTGATLSNQGMSSFAQQSAAVGPLMSEVDAVIVMLYRKKLKIGLPEPAVRKKMADDGITDPNIYAAVFSAPEPTTGATISYQTISSSAQKAAAVGPQMSEEDASVVMSYRKKLKIGLPEPAVRKKMADDGITDPNIYAAVFSAPEPTTGATISYQTISSPAEKAAAVGPQLSEEDAAIVMAYRNKLKIGLPEPAVRKKMADDGIMNPIIVDAVFSAAEPTVASVVSVTPQAQAQSSLQSALLQKIPRASKPKTSAAIGDKPPPKTAVSEKQSAPVSFVQPPAIEVNATSSSSKPGSPPADTSTVVLPPPAGAKRPGLFGSRDDPTHKADSKESKSAPKTRLVKKKVTNENPGGGLFKRIFRKNARGDGSANVTIASETLKPETVSDSAPSSTPKFTPATAASVPATKKVANVVAKKKVATPTQSVAAPKPSLNVVNRSEAAPLRTPIRSTPAIVVKPDEAPPQAPISSTPVVVTRNDESLTQAQIRSTPIMVKRNDEAPAQVIRSKPIIINRNDEALAQTPIRSKPIIVTQNDELPAQAPIRPTSVVVKKYDSEPTPVRKWSPFGGKNDGNNGTSEKKQIVTKAEVVHEDGRKKTITTTTTTTTTTRVIKKGRVARPVAK
jgi:hypothetical protein